MTAGRKTALTCLSFATVVFLARLPSIVAFTPSVVGGSFSASTTFAMKKITCLSYQRGTNAELCPEIPTTPRNPSNEVAVRDFRRMGGVVDVVVGYTGGKGKNPTYQNIMDATEAFLVEFDPTVISYKIILDAWADIHAPYYPSKTQYRSAIFYCSEEQRVKANEKIQELGRNGSRKVYVDLEPVSLFYKAEEYHQDFLDKQTG
ncbi:hypothetical protein ACHAW6_016027 [Cyclotella cf. meneghiniana]